MAKRNGDEAETEAAGGGDAFGEPAASHPDAPIFDAGNVEARIKALLDDHAAAMTGLLDAFASQLRDIPSPFATPGSSPQRAATGVDGVSVPGAVAAAVGCDPADVLACRLEGGRIAVVTRDGRRLEAGV